MVKEKTAKSIQSLEKHYKKPIGNILKYAAKLESSTEDPIMLDYTQKMKEYGVRLFRGFQMVAEHEKLSNNFYPHKRQCIDLVRFMRGIAWAAAPYAHKNGIAFTYRLPSEPVITITEIEPLTTICGHLLSNACRFKAPNDVISVDLYRRGENALIFIWDRGPGIPDEVAQHVFEPYYSYDPGGADFAGCGLGLTLANQFAQFLGGSLDFGPNRQGTFFVLKLPLHRRKRPRLSRPPIPKETFQLIMSDTIPKCEEPDKNYVQDQERA